MKEMTTREVQLVSLEILKDVHEFCVKNDIKYSLSGGTLLGAIRHNGFIPWDDDVDIQMPRPDYDRFIHTYVSPKYKVYSRELTEFEKKCMTYAYARVCEMDKTFVDTGVRPWILEDTGIWIDILPCDGIPSEYKEAKRHFKRFRKLLRPVYLLGFKNSSWEKIKKGTSVTAKIRYVIEKLMSGMVSENSYDKMLAVKKRYDYTMSEYFFTTSRRGLGELQPRKNMEKFELHQFEDAEFYIMSGYEANLTSLYGDYMAIPPENKRISHGVNHYYWR